MRSCAVSFFGSARAAAALSFDRALRCDDAVAGPLKLVYTFQKRLIDALELDFGQGLRDDPFNPLNGNRPKLLDLDARDP